MDRKEEKEKNNNFVLFFGKYFPLNFIDIFAATETTTTILNMIFSR